MDYADSPEEIINMDRAEALEAFAEYDSDDDSQRIYLPPSLLAEIAAEDLPVNVPVGVGIYRSNYLEVLWHGQLVRTSATGFSVTISYEIPPKYWLEAIGARFWLDLLHRCVQSRVDSIDGLRIEEYDDSGNNVILLDYSFPINGDDLKEAYDEAFRVQQEIEALAESVLTDVTKTLATSASKVLTGHYARPAEMVAMVDKAMSAQEKGDSLEKLMAALFAQFPGFNVHETKVHSETEEMDLVILNGSQDPIFSKDGPIIIVECKNWTAKTGRPEFSILESKIRNRHRRCTIAFLVSWSGFTDTTWREHLRSSRENYVIVCLEGRDIRRTALAGNFPDFLRQATLAALAS